MRAVNIENGSEAPTRPAPRGGFHEFALAEPASAFGLAEVAMALETEDREKIWPPMNADERG